MASSRYIDTTALAKALVKEGDHILYDTPALHLSMPGKLDGVQQNAMVVSLALTNGDCLTVVSESKKIRSCNDFWLPSAIVGIDEKRTLKTIVEALTKDWTGIRDDEFLVDPVGVWEKKAPYAFEKAHIHRVYQTLCVRIKLVNDNDKYDPHPDEEIRGMLKNRKNVLATIYKNDVPGMRNTALNNAGAMTFVKQALNLEEEVESGGSQTNGP